ncbi:MAG: signal peptidase I [Xanthobacteraceae bacterium]
MRSWLRTIVDLAVIVLIITVAKSAIAEPYYVPSGSMEPTLKIGDELLATKYSYGYSTASLPLFMNIPATARILGALPRRGDVAVFRAPADSSQIWVKRVIGLPGDRIAMREGRLLINGQPVGLAADGLGRDESEDGSRQLVPRFIETLPGGRKHLIFQESTSGPINNFPEFTVPAGHLFVMGDNRDNSDDSRVPVSFGGVGMLPVSNLVGRVNVLLGSWDLATAHKPFWDWPSGLRLSRFFTAVK